jgi:asparagine synthase (glutamine-hydrolysing)
MCGISGILGAKASAQASVAAMERMLQAQHHRGPDARACEAVGDTVLLGHNRLSILDLSAHANQPMTTRDGRYHLVFNGEIYNYIELRSQLESHYSFATSSDSEVLLYAFAHWGIECLNKLNGMFAFAIYDASRKVLTLARDRFGVKPLHYAYDEALGAFVFASEIKALHAYGIAKQPNAHVWANYLSFGHYQYQEQTFCHGVFSLASGHYAQINVAQPLAPVKPQKWYDFVGRVKALQSDSAFCNRDATEHLAHYKALLQESVSLRFRADVPVGFNISGGVDSSTLLGAVNQLHPSSDMEAFSFYTNDARYDEIQWVERVIAHTNKPLNKVLLSAQEMPELSQALMHFQDEPYGGIPTIAYAQLFKAAREKGIIVLLDGQGLDEAWAGKHRL